MKNYLRRKHEAWTRGAGRLISLLLAVVLVAGYAHTGLGNGMVNMIGTLLRQLLPVPIIYVVAKLAGVDYVWYVFWFSNLCALAYALLSLRHTCRKVLDPMESEEERAAPAPAS